MRTFAIIKIFFVLIFFVKIGSIECSKSDEIDNLIKGDQDVIDKGEGLIVKILKHKKNCKKIAEIGDHLDVHYVGRLDDENGKIFDSLTRLRSRRRAAGRTRHVPGTRVHPRAGTGTLHQPGEIRFETVLLGTSR